MAGNTHITASGQISETKSESSEAEYARNTTQIEGIPDVDCQRLGVNGLTWDNWVP